MTRTLTLIAAALMTACTSELVYAPASAAELALPTEDVSAIQTQVESVIGALPVAVVAHVAPDYATLNELYEEEAEALAYTRMNEGLIVILAGDLCTEMGGYTKLEAIAHEMMHISGHTHPYTSRDGGADWQEWEQTEAAVFAAVAQNCL